jgi:CheY-like chemotaxis protein
LNTLFLNATTNASLLAIQEIEELGHQVTVANSLSSALRSIEKHHLDLIVIDANLEFSSTDALMYLRQAFTGNIVAYGENLSPATRQFLAHVGIATVLASISDVISLQKLNSDVRVPPRAA